MRQRHLPTVEPRELRLSADASLKLGRRGITRVRRRRALSSGLLSACVVIVGGCSAGGGARSGQSGDCASLADTICKSAEQCSPSVVSVQYGDAATCIARYVLACQAATTASGASVKPADYAACASAYAQLDCTHLMAVFNGRPSPAACLVYGSRADGKACGQSTQCASGYCQPNSVTCGTCEEHQPAGAACKFISDCKSGLTCLASNAHCGQPEPAGASCKFSTDCALGLVCTSAGKCGKPGQAGASCTTLTDCDVMQGLACNAQKACAPAGFAKAGEACGLVNGSFVACEGGAYCPIPQGQTQGSCKAPAPDGAACSLAQGPPCLAPAACINGTCRLPDPASCG